MDKRNKSTLPGLIVSKNSTSSLEGIKNAKGSRGSSALPIMKHFGNVKPSRNERIIKPDMTSGGKVTKQDLPIIREVLKPGFSGNFRTNYTPPSSFDPDAAAFFAAVELAGGTIPDNVKTEYNELVLREKSASRYSKMLRLYPYLGGVIDSARIDAINLGQATNNNFVNADADATCGLQGNGIDKYLLDVNTYGSLSSPYNYQIFNFAKTVDTSGTNIYSWGGFDGSNQVGQRMIGSTRYYFYANTTTILLDSLPGAASDGDSNICARFNATSAKLFINGTEIDSSTTDATGFTDFGSASLFAAYNNDSSTPSAFSNEEKVGWILAENMTEAEALATESSYNTFLTNIGAI